MEPLLVRDQHLSSIGQFAARLAKALALEGERSSEELEKAFVAECVGCGVKVPGTEILALACASNEAQDGTSKLGRLHFGYCARKGCKSYFYKLKFFPHPHFDWPGILARTDRVEEEVPAEIIAAQQEQERARREQRKRRLINAGAVAGMVVLLFCLFQWYNGGTIPFVREPASALVSAKAGFNAEDGQ